MCRHDDLIEAIRFGEKLEQTPAVVRKLERLRAEYQALDPQDHWTLVPLSKRQPNVLVWGDQRKLR